MSIRAVKESTVNAVMVQDELPIIIPLCASPTPSRFGWHLRFISSPTHPLLKGRDVDYEWYGYKTHDGGSLESWFGPTASSVDAFEERYVKSTSFSERSVVLQGQGVIGIDARGVYKNGRKWRWLGADPIMGEQSVEWRLKVATNEIGYDNASENDVKEFDTVIDSVCAAR